MTYSSNLNAGQFIQTVLQMMNVVSLPDSAQSGDYRFAFNILNMMLKSWSSQPHLWKRKQGVLFPTYNQYKYEIGSVNGADNCTLATGYVETTLTSTTLSTSTTIVVASITGMSVNDKIGIEQDGPIYTRFWTTIQSINPTTLTITLNSALPNQASSGNTIITYTNRINRPLEILRATILDLSTGTETPLEKLSYDQYMNLPVKTQLGRPVNYYYDRLINNSLPYTGTLYFINNPDKSSYIVKFTYRDMIQDVVNNTDILDFPQEWQLTVATNLAVLLDQLGYGKLIEAQQTQTLAAQLKAELESFDSDDEYLTIVINNTNRLVQ